MEAAAKRRRYLPLRFRSPQPVDLLHASGLPPHAVPGDLRPSSLRNWNGRHSYLGSLTLIAIATAIGLMLGRVLTAPNIEILYLLMVLASALTWGQRPAVFTAIASAVVFDFCFVPPYFSFAVTDLSYLVVLSGFVAAALVTSSLVLRARHQADTAQRSEANTAALYAMSRSFTSAANIDAVFQAIVEHTARTFRRKTIVLGPGPHGLEQRAASESETSPRSDADRAAAAWALQHAEHAGAETERSPDALMVYVPLATPTQTVGVLGLEAGRQERLLPNRRELLQAFANQSAIAIERLLLEDRAQQIAVLEQTEILQRALLRSMSHNLRTPLTSILAALSTLSEDFDNLDRSARLELIETAQGQTARLNRLVGHVLAMARVKAGALRPHIEPCDIEDVIGAALGELKDALSSRRVSVDVPRDFPHVAADFVLIEQVMVNLLDNARKYSPPDTPIRVSACRRESDVEVIVADSGVGIRDDEREHVFDEFHRGDRANDSLGLGLGLAICKGFVEANGGRISVRSSSSGGTAFCFTLPLAGDCPLDRHVLP